MSNEESLQDAQPEAVEAVEAQENKTTNTEALADALDIQVSPPSAAPVTDEGGVIGSPNTKKKGGKTSGSVKTLEGGAIGSGAADKDAVVAGNQRGEGKSVLDEKVALHSTRNVNWPGVGKVVKGYNIVSPEAAEKWMNRSHIREATPEEIAREYGN